MPFISKKMIDPLVNRTIDDYIGQNIDRNDIVGASLGPLDIDAKKGMLTDYLPQDAVTNWASLDRGSREALMRDAIRSASYDDDATGTQKFLKKAIPAATLAMAAWAVPSTLAKFGAIGAAGGASGGAGALGGVGGGPTGGLAGVLDSTGAIIPGTEAAAGGVGSGGFWSKLGSGIKGAFTNPNGGLNWQNILSTAGTVGEMFAEPKQATLPGFPSWFSEPLEQRSFSRPRNEMPKESYYTYGKSGGEHNFFAPQGTPPGPTATMRNQMMDPNQRPPSGFNLGGRYVRGPGSGRSDDIDARLSDGEYVMDAETVALLGDGSLDEGARRLDQLRENIRKHKGENLVKGKFSADAKPAEDYLAKGGRPKRPKYIVEAPTSKPRKGNITDIIYADVGEGPWRSRRQAQRFLDAEVGAPGARVREKAKGGRMRGDWVQRVIPGGKPQLTDAERRAQLAAVQRFRDALKAQQPEPRLRLVKAEGGAVKELERFATDLETAVKTSDQTRMAEIERQLDGVAAGSAKFFKEGFAKGGKVVDLIPEFTRQSSAADTRQIIEELRRLKPESEILRSFEASERARRDPIVRRKEKR